MMATASCLLCGTAGLEAVGDEAFRCGACGILINRHAQPLDYAEGGGQAAPDANKMRWRLENARMRLAIIAPHLAGHELFVDIGCGSGEMLQAAAAYFAHRIGFDTNIALARHARTRGDALVFESAFDAALIPPALAGKSGVFALSHVLEHLDKPMALVEAVAAAMASGDLLYLEVPLHTGQTFRQQGFGWNLWNREHVALYSPQALDFITQRAGLECLHQATRIFARGSRSGKTRLRLFLRAPLRFLRVALTKPACHSLADLMIADYGCMVLRKP